MKTAELLLQYEQPLPLRRAYHGREELGLELQALLSYDILPEMEIWVIGAFKGKTLKVLHELFQPAVLRAFDPQPHSFEHLSELGIADLVAFPFALGDHTALLPMRELGNDGCSFYGGDGVLSSFNGDRDVSEQRFPMIDIKDQWSGQLLSLVLLNCEGSEYMLLPRMKECGMLEATKYLLVQYHDHVASDEEWHSIAQMMLITHVPTFVHWPAWVSWGHR